MFTKEEQDKILKKMENMSDKDKKELNESIREAFNKPVETPKPWVCQCCYCASKRGFG